MLKNNIIKNELKMNKKINRINITFLFVLLFQFVNAQSFDGFALYNSQGSNTTYLIDENQNIAHTWNMNTECNYTVQLKENGNLIRGTKYNSNILNGAADAGRVQEIAPDGTIVWDYIYSDANHLSHHDLTLVGDNVLITAWEVKTAAELTSAGYTTNSDKWPTHFIELQDDGNGGANIVWEWHIWDHMCQDVDPNKPNYVTDISDYPELIDINMIQSSGGGGGPGGGGGGDWFHVNGVDYNEDLDQIIFSSRHASEIYIIDHSTTTNEAASHSGGNSGMGGDILYRWGNPSNYGMSGAQVIESAVHDARWITDDGRPNGGFLQIFNNCGNGCTGNGPGATANSTIDGIEAPWDAATNSYLRIPGQAFGPASYTTRYACAYSASGQSASDRMSNGNIFVNASNPSGVMYEVDAVSEQIIWGPYQSGSQKGFRYECDYPGIIALEPYMNTATTSCFSSVFVDDIDDVTFLSPNPTNGVFTIAIETSILSGFDILVYNMLGQETFKKEVSSFLGEFKQEINLEDCLEGMYIVRVISDKGPSYTNRVSYIK
ncbi:MAG: hypothetical protein CMD28_02495 [Flavobacteriales bacterium]|nr:hypothetical protein [Flavobacteriales bacterium]